MEFLFALVPLMIVAAVIGLIMLISSQYEKKRTAALAHLAVEMSLVFSPKGEPIVRESLGGFKFMQSGRNQTVSNLISGQTQSVVLSVFDYSYITGSGKNKHTHKHSVVAFDSPQLDLPEFDLIPENLFHKLASKFGYQDIDFDGYPTFNRKYLLRGPDESAVRELFTEDVVQFFEARLDERKKINQVEGRGSRLIVIAKPRVKPAETRPLMDHAFAIYGALKTIADENLTVPILSERDRGK